MPDPAQPASTLDAVLLSWAETAPDRPLLATAETPNVVTARELATLAGAAAGTLARWGIGPGDRVAVWGQNSVAWAVWLCAAAWRGAALVALHPALEPADLMNALRRARAHWLIVDETARGRPLGEIAGQAHLLLGSDPDNALRGIAIVPGGDGVLDLGRFVDRGTPPPSPAGRPAAALNLQFTSGSTGLPKAVVLSQRALILNALRTAEAAGIDGSDRVVSPLPLHHAAGLSSGLVLSLVTGALWCSSHRYEPATSRQLIETHAGTVFQGVPTMFKGLIDAVSASPLTTDALRLGFIGGAPCPESLCREAIEALGLERMAIVYGQTEFGPTISMTTGTEPKDLALSSVGHPIAATEIRIVDPESGREAPTGEILVRGETVMNGYFGDPGATAAAITSEGWLRTGDLGRVDRGCLSVVGRLKELIVRGGENVSPAEIEDALRRAPGVGDVVVVPAPHAHWGEAICAVVQAADGRTIDLDALSAFCGTRLARYKHPDRFILRDALPTLPSGKVDRAAVRRAVAEGDW